jgi:hypothetical protein
MRGVKRLVVATVIALATGVVADASNLSFLANTPSGHFNSEDMRLLREAAMDLLLHEDVGASRDWRNPQSTASGKIKITKAFKSTDGFLCKVLRIDNSAADWHGRATYPVCEIHPGDWKIHTEAKSAAEQPESPDKGAH